MIPRRSGQPGLQIRPVTYSCSWTQAAAAITGMAGWDEAITVALMKVALRMRTARLAYALPQGYLEMGGTRMLALPAKRFLVSGVQLR